MIFNGEPELERELRQSTEKSPPSGCQQEDSITECYSTMFCFLGKKRVVKQEWNSGVGEMSSNGN
ncbi:hypothetical protein NQ318_002154 [Aromia moschata]|uniref:Uncharacterized protein n=1 Tax=Aromia moschata TaxID=1265417 RepID=A0AAV8XGD0_9CUCU|nr:hypothetical protein NQ318_002154 [Aromia moschata]